ncbi:MAG: hypothetical protein L6406_12225 [Desulfobacterales bacterium]|nr:hypothetical protein [Desulfobacterales bacterium]
MKVKLKTYKYKGMLDREFPSVEEAEKIAGIMAEKYPNFLFELHIELDESSVIVQSESEISAGGSSEIDPSQMDTRPLDISEIDLTEWDEEIAISDLE